jgi:hypothetical protein
MMVWITLVVVILVLVSSVAVLALDSLIGAAVASSVASLGVSVLFVIVWPRTWVRPRRCRCWPQRCGHGLACFALPLLGGSRRSLSADDILAERPRPRRRSSSRAKGDRHA